MNIHSRMKAENERRRRLRYSCSYEHNHKTTLPLWSMREPFSPRKCWYTATTHGIISASRVHTRIRELVYGRHLPHNAVLHQGFEAFRVFCQNLKRFRKTCNVIFFAALCIAGWSMRSFHRQPRTADVRSAWKAKTLSIATYRKCYFG